MQEFEYYKVDLVERDTGLEVTVKLPIIPQEDDIIYYANVEYEVVGTAFEIDDDDVGYAVLFLEER